MFVRRGRAFRGEFLLQNKTGVHFLANYFVNFTYILTHNLEMKYVPLSLKVRCWSLLENARLIEDLRHYEEMLFVYFCIICPVSAFQYISPNYVWSALLRLLDVIISSLHDIWKGELLNQRHTCVDYLLFNIICCSEK